MKQNRKEELEQEYERLVQGLRRAREIEDAGLGGPPVLPNDLLQSGTSKPQYHMIKRFLAIPGSIRKADNFCGWLRRLLEYFSSRLRVQQTVQESPLSFLKDLQNKILIDVRSLRLASERFQNLINTLQLIDLQVITAPPRG